MNCEVRLACEQRFMTKTSKRQRFSESDRGSSIIELVEAAWSTLRGIEPQIPAVVLTLVDAKSRRSVRGYFADARWKKPGRYGGAHEVGISPNLIGQPTALLATMLHEAAHAILHNAGKNGGIGSTCYYHTKLFRDCCNELGLECSFRNTRYGWTDTQWPMGTGTPKRFAPVVEILRSLPSGTGKYRLRRSLGRPLPQSGRMRLVCNCDDDRRAIYVPKSVAVAGGILCKFCSQPFRNESE